MIDNIQAFWTKWKNTSIGKSVEDFYWNVLATSVVAGISAAMPVMIGGETNFQVVWGIFFSGVSIAFFKSLSLFWDKYKSKLTPNTPQG